MKRILYVQHADAMGGSVLSLASLVQRLDRARYSPTVACAGPEGPVTAFHRLQGVDTLACPDLSIFPHTTAGWLPLYDPRALMALLRAVLRFPGSMSAARALIRRVKPDLVHLNSVVLAPSALGAAREGVPIVWHVREAVVHGHVGLRRRLIRRWLDRIPSEVIFISEHEQRLTFGGRKGVTIPNAVDLQRFDPSLDGTACRRELDLSAEDQVVLYLGGLGEIKGIRPFLAAMRLERERNPRLRVLIGAALTVQSSRWLARAARIVLPLVGRPTQRQWAERYLDRHAMRDYVRLLPFRPDVERLLAAADLLVFPSIVPHFARPVIEAGAMAKPVVASRIGGVDELVEDGVTGLLVPPGDVAALADAVRRVLLDPALAARLGAGGHERARRLYDADVHVRRIEAVYDRILA